MSSASWSRRSISKHSGALMSSRLMPPNVGASADADGDDLVDGPGVHADRVRVDVTELLEQDRLALHDRHAPLPVRCRRGRAPRCRSTGPPRRWNDRCTARPARVRRRSPATPVRRRGCRPAPDPRDRRRATREAMASLPPTCRANAGSSAYGSVIGMLSGITVMRTPGVWSPESDSVTRRRIPAGRASSTRSALTLCSAPPPDPYRNEYGCGDACCCGDTCCHDDRGRGDGGDEHE